MCTCENCITPKENIDVFISLCEMDLVMGKHFQISLTAHKQMYEKNPL